MVAQLRGMNDPPLTEAEITRERLALEEAIRKVEAEAARRGRDAPRRSRLPQSPTPDAATRRRKPRHRRPSARRAPSRPRTPSRTVTDEGLKGFRDVIAEAEALGDATAQGAKTAREVFAATPPSGQTTFDRVEPRVEPEGLRTPRAPAQRGRPSRRARVAPSNRVRRGAGRSACAEPVAPQPDVRPSRVRVSSVRARCVSPPPTTSTTCRSIRASGWLPRSSPCC